MLQHHNGTSGYAYLYLILVLCVCLASALFSALGSMLGMANAGKIAGGVIFIAFWIIGFIVMQRFLYIENRRPTLSEANVLSVKSVMTVLGVLICVGVCVALVGLILNLISSLGSGNSGASPGGNGGGQAPQKRGGNSVQNRQAIGALWGAFAAMFILYAAPFLNLAILSRLFRPGSPVAS